MKQIQIINYLVEPSLPGGYDRCVENGFLIASDIAAIIERYALSFVRVKPSAEGVGMYEYCCYLCELDVILDTADELSNLPANLPDLIEWMTSKQDRPLAAAV
ncbi:hypothetical protein ABEW34_07625 [Paenibacillus algorifonticola]|uniref:hypothetical protein n=1 Tax=Paenibacillus algorifonticola TaxID=684063 RepID=UPI003D2D15DD